MTNPLIVPVQVNAYLVNEAMRYHKDGPYQGLGEDHGYGRWTLNFNATKDLCQPPEPKVSKGAENPPELGAYVHWLLPHALRATREGAFPAVPNRWLVLRSSRTGSEYTDPVSLRGWVVESDYLDDRYKRGHSNPNLVKENWSPYPYVVTDNNDPNYLPGETKEMALGHPFDAAAWPPDHGSGKELPGPFTAVGPGIPAFCGYQPYCRGVFSFYDDLQDVGDQATLDYFVLGWYADTGQDILAGPKTDDELEALLVELGWSTLGRGTPLSGGVSLYAGTALKMPWVKAGYVLDGNIPTSTDEVRLSVGHDTAEAQSADGQHNGGQAAFGRLFQAFLTDTFQHLQSQPAQFSDTMHDSWFIPRSPDRAWAITDAQPPAGSVPLARPTDDELKTERDWLATLNNNQQQYDLLARNMAGLQDRLYELWRLQLMRDDPDIDVPESFPDPQNKIDDLVTRVGSVHSEMERLLTLIPHGDTQKELQDNIDTYAGQHGLDPQKRVLGPAPSQPFCTPSDPVVLLDGIYADAEKAPKPYPDVLLCRTPDLLVAQMTIDGHLQSPPASPALPNYPGLPPQAQAAFPGLFAEFLLLSRAAVHGTDLPDDCATLGKKGKLDEGISNSFHNVQQKPTGPGCFYTPSYFDTAPDLTLWHQPWEPAYLLWEMEYYPIPADNGPDHYHWKFDSASGRYQLCRPAGPVTVEAQSFTGRCALTDLPKRLLKAAVERHARLYPDAPWEALEQLAAHTGSGDISQSVEGFNRALLQRQPGIGIAPSSDPLKTALASYAYPDSGFPDPDAHSHFNPACSGQFVFTYASVVDSMGRCFILFDKDSSNANFSLAQHMPRLADTLLPTRDTQGLVTVSDGKEELPEGCYVQLAPRLLQPTRLRFDFVSTNDTYTLDPKTHLPVPPTVIHYPPQEVATAEHPAATSVIGWLLSNYVTGSLLIHDQNGLGIIEGRKGIGTDGKDAVDWAALPYVHSVYPHGEPDEAASDFAQQCPELFGFITKLKAAGTEAFEALTQRIGDPTSASQPPGNDGPMMAPLVGQPVALLRARLTLETDTLPVTDPSWDTVLKFNTPDYLAQQWKWNVRLGGQQKDNTGNITTTDGLIGYFTHKTGPDGSIDRTAPTDYSVLRAADGKDSGYVQKITAEDLALPVSPAPMPQDPDPDPALNPNDPFTAYVTLLAHPWADINAITDLLPTATLRLPDEAVRTPLSRLRLALRVGPLLAGTRPLPDDVQDNDADTNQQDAMVIPCPSAWTGTWHWSEPRPDTSLSPKAHTGQATQGDLLWNHYALAPTDDAAHLDQPQSSARTGYLTLTTALGQTPPPPPQTMQSRDTPVPQPPQNAEPSRPEPQP